MNRTRIKFTVILLLLVSTFSFSQIKVACVGNSITYGAGIKGKDSLSYPAQLGKILGSEYDVRNFGNSGATMLKNGNKPYWNLPQFAEAKEFKPNYIIILLGTNDSKPVNWDQHKSEYVKDYIEMITVFKNIENDPIIYLGLPIPVVENRWNIRKDIVENDITNLINKIALDFELGTINFYPLFENNHNLIPDNIHPNAEGAGLMAELAAKKILND